MNNYDKKMLNGIKQSLIALPNVSRDILLSDAITDFNIRLLREGEEPASRDSDSRFLDRIMVNYIRHKLISYQDQLHHAHRVQMRNTAYFLLKRKILDRIKEAYPFLANECNRQKQFIGD